MAGHQRHRQVAIASRHTCRALQLPRATAAWYHKGAPPIPARPIPARHIPALHVTTRPPTPITRHLAKIIAPPQALANRSLTG